jgi:hypothetical protein
MRLEERGARRAEEEGGREKNKTGVRRVVVV